MIYDAAYEIVLDEIFLRLDSFIPHLSVLLKIEGLNPARSIKLKTAVSLIESLEASSCLHKGSRIIESSSGNLGTALSVICAAKGYQLTIVTDPNAAELSVRMMEALGTSVIMVTDRDANGGFLGTRIAYIMAALAQDNDLLWPNQYASIANPDAHYQRTARSIHREIPHADVILVGVGTGGTLVGCLSYYREHSPATRVVAVDAAGSVIFGGASAPRHIPGIGASRVPELLRDPGDLERILVTEQDTVDMCWRLAREHGIAAGGSTGSVLAAAGRLASTLPDGATVVAISPDLGEQYLESVYSEDWIKQHLAGARVSP